MLSGQGIFSSRLSDYLNLLFFRKWFPVKKDDFKMKMV